jgi:hypothetical protein
VAFLNLIENTLLFFAHNPVHPQKIGKGKGMEILKLLNSFSKLPVNQQLKANS